MAIQISNIVVNSPHSFVFWQTSEKTGGQTPSWRKLAGDDLALAGALAAARDGAGQRPILRFVKAWLPSASVPCPT